MTVQLMKDDLCVLWDMVGQILCEDWEGGHLAQHMFHI
jgi:hypothetical protein